MRSTWKGAVLAASLLAEGVFSRWTGIPLNPSIAACLSYGLLGVAALVIFIPDCKSKDCFRPGALAALVPLACLAIGQVSRPNQLPLLTLFFAGSVLSFLPGNAGRTCLEGVLIVLPALMVKLAGVYTSPTLIAVLFAVGYLIGEAMHLKVREVSIEDRLKTGVENVFGHSGAGVAAGLVSISLFLFVIILLRQPPVPAASGCVLIDNGHGSTEPVTVGLDESEFLRGNFGHGRLVSILEKWGFTVQILEGELTSETLQEGDVLVSICPSKPYLPRELAAVHRFIEAGGSLLGIGEHTDLDGVMSYLNPIFEPLAMQLSFDAVYIPSGTDRHLVFANHPAVSGINEISVSTGASLNGTAMTPLIWTRSGTFSDDGRRVDGIGRLGNRLRDRGETVGFQVLAGSVLFGLGKAVLLGDSSYFQNTNLFCNKAFAWSLFSWLCRSSAGNLLTTWSLVLVLVTTSVLLLVLTARFRPEIRLVALVIPVGLALFIGAGGDRAGPPVFPESTDRPVIALDLAHIPKFDLFFRTDNKIEGQYVDSVCLQMVRLGLEPRLLNGKGWGDEALSGCSGLILTPSMTELDALEELEIRSFMETGGRVLVVGGRDGTLGDSSWLTRVGCRVDPSPLWFRFPVKRLDGLTGRFASPPYRARFSPGMGLFHRVNRFLLDVPVMVAGGEPFLSLEGYPVGVRKSVGQGELLVIGDEELMLDGHLEDSRGIFDADKVVFWRNLLQYLAGGESR
ncbi:MAG: hypothetical protein QGH40_08530 [bacterium]|nr:hypothetical protein [bacterium]